MSKLLSITGTVTVVDSVNVRNNHKGRPDRQTERWETHNEKERLNMLTNVNAI